jgi:hypothetical protein
MFVELEAGRSASSIADDSSAQSLPQSHQEPRQGFSQHDKTISPALVPWKRGDASAYELKFVLDEKQSHEVESLLAGHLVRDPFALPELGSAYRINTVYCDTPAFEVFHGVGSSRRRKYRVRTYGAPDSRSLIYLERKTKVGQKVRKKRATIEASELAALSTFQPREGWHADWFHRQLLIRRLNPICCVSYLRTAYVGANDMGPIRLTFDRNLSGYATTGWLPNSAAEPIPFLAGRVVCEFKFRGTLPTLFKSAIQSLQLTSCGNSKYRHCLLAAAVATHQDKPHA